jgi:chorismate synthase
LKRNFSKSFSGFFSFFHFFFLPFAAPKNDKTGAHFFPLLPPPNKTTLSINRYGIRAVAGGGRSSARETVGRVAAGAVAKKLLAVVGEQGENGTGSAVEVLAYVSRVRDVGCEVDDATFTLAEVESNPVREERKKSF